MAETSRDPITAAELHRMLGDLDDATCARIIATGATRAEVLEAQQWLSADDQLGTDLERGKHGVVGEIYEILLEAEAPLDDAER
jgi:hypothetical protein